MGDTNNLLSVKDGLHELDERDHPGIFGDEPLEPFDSLLLVSRGVNDDGDVDVSEREREYGNRIVQTTLVDGSSENVTQNGRDGRRSGSTLGAVSAERHCEPYPSRGAVGQGEASRLERHMQGLRLRTTQTSSPHTAHVHGRLEIGIDASRRVGEDILEHVARSSRVLVETSHEQKFPDGEL